MTTRLIGVTMALPGADALSMLYADLFGWSVGAQARVTGEQAAFWGAPSTEGALTMRMETGGAWIRIVDQDAPLPAPYQTLGWAGAEVLVADLDAFVAALPGDGFRRLAEPSALSVTPDIRFCPVVGPAGELWLFTEVRNRAFGVESAARTVERPFLVTGGTHDPDAEAAGWATLGLQPTRLAAAMPGVSATHGLPPDHRHAMALFTLDGPSFLEAARYPDAAGPRSVPSGGLPPGVAFVTLGSPGLAPRLLASPSGLTVETMPL